MRVREKNKILNLIQTIKEAHEEIRKYMIKKDYKDAKELMILCQSGVNQIKDTLIQLKANSSLMAEEIESYCITVSSISEDLSINNSIAEIHKSLNNQISHLETVLRDEIKEEYYILFLPYKASMWDSLESIWIAARDDDTCFCDVMPIPYYDRGGDGSLTKSYYEGGLFPDYVPITNYLEYDLNAQRPDVIYFHNPYDQMNYVTTVHPDYYSTELLKYTDMLVYVPYFISFGEVQKHFCQLPGILNADKVVLQSESIRKQYIECYKELFQLGNKQARELGLDNKFVAMGSPKIDKVITSMKTKPEIPSEWMSIIGNGEKRKKIVLYNTHLDSLLNHGEEFLKKLEFVFCFFKRQTDAVLLWRPHPFSESTILSMKPEIYREYNIIKQKYVTENIGIFDDTSDLHRAITLADAYYGDWSSLVGLFGLTGKPIMIQDKDLYSIPDNELMRSFWIEGICVDGDNAWFAAESFNGLYYMDLKTYQKKLLGVFPNAVKFQFRLYSTIKKYKNKLLCVPMAADNITIYDIDTNQFHELHLRKNAWITDHMFDPLRKFLAVVPYEKWMFIVGCSYPAIIRLDMETEEMVYFTEWVEDLQKFILDKTNVYFRYDTVIQGHTFLIASCIANVVMSFDLQSCKHKFIQIEGCDHGFNGLAFDGENYWLGPRKQDEIIKWNPAAEVKTTVLQYPKGYGSVNYNCISMIYFKDEIWFVPGMTNMFLKINPKTNEMVCMKRWKDEEINEFKYNVVFNYKNRLNFFAFNHCRFVHFDDNGNEITDCYLTSSITEYSIIMSHVRQTKYEQCKNWMECVFYENEKDNLEDFINYVLVKDSGPNNYQRQLFRPLNKYFDGTCGEKIHSSMIGDINI